MKKKLYFQRLFVSLASIMLIFACRKSLDNLNTSTGQGSNGTQQGNTNIDSSQTQTSQDSSAIPFPSNPNYYCKGPDYGDSIIFPQPTAPLQDYIVNPVFQQGKGTYVSWPEGLVLNSSTGAIDVTQSATGQRYTIGYIKNGTHDTCLANIIIGGAAFSDSIYVFSKNAKFANPFYNANPNITSVCVGSGPGSPTCQWDINGLAQAQRVIVDNHTGVIDLEKTLNGGAFGPVLFNGASVQVDIYYSLTDQSNGAIQHTPVKLIYYDKKSNVPPSLLGQVLNREINIVDQVLITLGGNPRPPLIIITRDN
jgi:hypothetical protein